MWYNLSEMQVFLLHQAIYGQMKTLHDVGKERPRHRREYEMEIARLKEISNILYEDGRVSYDGDKTWYNLSQEQAYVLLGAIYGQVERWREKMRDRPQFKREEEIEQLQEVSDILYDEGRPSFMELAD